MKKISIILLLVLFVAAGCDKTEQSSENSNTTTEVQTDNGNTAEVVDSEDGPQMTVIEKGFYSNYQDKKNLLITNRKDLEEMWNKAHALVQPAPSVPKIDFTKEVVVAVFMGQKTAGGHSITISNVAADNSTLKVSVTEASPGDDCMTTQALTQPFHIVKVSGSYDKADFSVAKKTNGCGE